MSERRPIPGKPGYEVGSDGTVWSCWKRGPKPIMTNTWRQLTGNRQRYGHVNVTLGRGDFRFVHRLVLEVFVGQCPPGLECRHLDGDAGNNRLENLVWGTPGENMNDKIGHGTSNRGEKGTKAKLTAKLVLEILEHLRGGMSLSQIAARYGVTSHAICAISRGRSWSHITGIAKPDNLSSSNREACKRYSEQKRLRRIASESK